MMNYLKPYENIFQNEKGGRRGDIIKFINFHLLYHYFFFSGGEEEILLN